MRRLLIAALLATVLVGCGGGGGVFIPPYTPDPVALGTVPLNAPTTFPVRVVNTFSQPATVTTGTLGAGLAIAGGQLPLSLAPGAEADLNVVLTPPGAGLYAGSVGLALTASGNASTQETPVSATVELPTAALNLPSVNFGLVITGASADRFVLFSNTSLVSDVHLTAVSLPDPAYTLLSPAVLPVTLGPGEDAVLQIRYTAGTQAPSGFLTLTSDARNGPFQVFLQASTGGQEVVTFEDETFNASGDTRELSFDVAADAISFMIEATTDPGTDLGLRLLMGPGNREYENEQLTGPYIWAIQPEIFTAQVPNTDRSEVQLVSGGGTYRFKLLRWSGSASQVDIRVIIERRPDPATRTLATLDLNVFLAAGIAPTAATAENNNTLQTVLTEMSRILGQQGIVVGDIDYYDITDTRYDDVTWSEFGDMLELSSAASEARLNLFFVRTAIGGGILGVSPTLGGPSVNGTPLSGVMSLYTTSNPTFVGLVAAHEVGHFLGLAHTVEQVGSHDDILDTKECPATGTNGVCSRVGGGYLMHWQAVGGTTISNGQGLVIRGHPHMSPRAGVALQAKPTLPRAVPVPANVSEHWCGTCRCMHRTVLK